MAMNATETRRERAGARIDEREETLHEIGQALRSDLFAVLVAQERIGASCRLQMV